MIKKDIVIIGSGIIGSTSAFHLASMGHNLILIDPEINKPISKNNSFTGSKASLGILMGNTFKRSSGRSWILRQRSMNLWPEWLKQLSDQNISLKIKTPFIQLAKDLKEMKSMEKLSHERSSLGITMLNNNTQQKPELILPRNEFGGLISHNDGWIDPIKILGILMKRLDELKVVKINRKVISLNRISQFNKNRWKIILDNKITLHTDYVIICAALGSQELLKKAGFNIPLQAVIGQAIEIEIKENSKKWENWPAVLNSNNINLIPTDENHMIIGASLEIGQKPNNLEIKNLKELNGNAPNWLINASITNKWYGIRAKPLNHPAPLLEELEPGLLINTAHYRNGILLAPACAEWIGNQL